MNFHTWPLWSRYLVAILFIVITSPLLIIGWTCERLGEFFTWISQLIGDFVLDYLGKSLTRFLKI